MGPDEDEMIEARAGRSDDEILAEVVAFAPLPHEDDPIWDSVDDRPWRNLTLFRALCGVVATRKLKQAIPLLLERACCGDPGEAMRDMFTDCLYFAAKPDGDYLIDQYLASTGSSWPGARLWAIDGLGRLRRFNSADFDAGRAAAIDEVLQKALADEDRIVRRTANSWLLRIREITVGKCP